MQYYIYTYNVDLPFMSLDDIKFQTTSTGGM